MNKTSILFLVLIACSIGALFVTLVDSSTYADFSQAFENRGEEFHVVGTLNREIPYNYNPQKDPNRFEFYMIDQLNQQRKVVLLKAMPADFDKSEKIVVVGFGSVNQEHFVAKDILLKCPSKYQQAPQDLAQKGI